jgi:hypothetical protein
MRRDDIVPQSTEAFDHGTGKVLVRIKVGHGSPREPVGGWSRHDQPIAGPSGIRTRQNRDRPQTAADRRIRGSPGPRGLLLLAWESDGGFPCCWDVILVAHGLDSTTAGSPEPSWHAGQRRARSDRLQAR